MTKTSAIGAPDFQFNVQGRRGAWRPVEMAGDRGGVVIIAAGGNLDVPFVGERVNELIDLLDAIGTKPSKFVADALADLKRRS